MPGEPWELAWPQRASGAISLTYDGTSEEQARRIAPWLARLGFKVTFFVSAPGVLQAMEDWRKVVDLGHEIGNASLYRVSDEGRLPNWTLRMVEQDLHMTQEFLRDNLVGEEPISFALPGTDLTCANGNYHPIIAKQFSLVRGQEEKENGAKPDFTNLGSYHGAAWLEGLAQRQAEGVSGWTILRLYGDEDPALIEQLADLSFWVAPMADVAKHLQRSWVEIAR